MYCPVQTAVCPVRCTGTPNLIVMGAQASVAGSNRPPLTLLRPVPLSPPQTSARLPVQTIVWFARAEGHPEQPVRTGRKLSAANCALLNWPRRTLLRALVLQAFPAGGLSLQWHTYCEGEMTDLMEESEPISAIPHQRRKGVLGRAWRLLGLEPAGRGQKLLPHDSGREEAV